MIIQILNKEFGIRLELHEISDIPNCAILFYTCLYIDDSIRGNSEVLTTGVTGRYFRIRSSAFQQIGGVSFIETCINLYLPGWNTDDPCTLHKYYHQGAADYVWLLEKFKEFNILNHKLIKIL